MTDFVSATASGLRSTPNTAAPSRANNVAVAVSYAEETSIPDAEAYAAEIYGTEGPWYLNAEAVEYGDGFTALSTR